MCHRRNMRKLAVAATLPIILAISLCFLCQCQPSQKKPAATQAAATWPSFRGPTGDGKAPAGSLLGNNLDSAKQLLWKVPIPAAGHSSPIIWGDRVFITAEENRILAFAAKTGKLLWDKGVQLEAPPPQAADEEPWKPGDHGTAVPTPCTDGKSIYAFFGDGSVGCVDFDGNQLWARRLIVRPQSSYGLAASPVLFKDLLIIQVDQPFDESVDPPKSRSFLAALRTSDGQEVWRRQRPVRDSWASPVIARLDGRDLLLTSAEPFIIAYDSVSGRELWRAKGPAGDVVASPIAAGDLIVACGDEGGAVTVVGARGSGDVSQSHLAWKWEQNCPATSSPVADDKCVYFVSASGTLEALNLQTGEEEWKKRLSSAFASPVLAGDRLLLIDSDGLARIISTADGAVVASANLGEAVTASPAICGTRVYIRSARRLLCLDSSSSRQ